MGIYLGEERVGETKKGVGDGNLSGGGVGTCW